MPPMKKMTLDKILQSQGFGTRKACQQMIADGKVSLSGEVVTEFSSYFQPESLALSVDGRPWACREFVYLAMKKPAGYECSRKPSHHPGVLSLLPEPFILRNTQYWAVIQYCDEARQERRRHALGESTPPSRAG